MAKVILSLDGGGIRGAATTQFLARLEEQLQTKHSRSIRDCVDFYAGTSTGSIIALCLATTDMSMDKINELYNYQNARKIFSEHKGLLAFDGINVPKFEARGKTEILKKNLGKARIKDVPADKHVLAVTYAIEKRRPVVIKSTKKDYLNLLSYQAADASSAAPTYFPTKEIKLSPGQDESWLVDGGVIANNPTMCAITEAKRTWRDVPLSEMRVLSVGTGFMTRKINGPESQRWGGIQWMTEGHIMEVLSDERIVAYQAMTIIDSGNYIRVNAKLKEQPGLPDPPDDAMDDVSKANIKRLKRLGNFWFEKYGEAAVQLLLDTYEGPSLDRIDWQSGKPIVN
ncbi:patatin-like phospholipase family protein [Desulfobacterota bacterium M19]